MGIAIVGVNGIPRLQNVSDLPTIYEDTLTVVSGSPGSGEIQTNDTDSNGDPVVNTGTSITLPNSQTYSGDELNVFLNGKNMTHLIDYNFVGAGPNRTQISFTFDLFVDDIVKFKIERNE